MIKRRLLVFLAMILAANFLAMGDVVKIEEPLADSLDEGKYEFINQKSDIKVIKYIQLEHQPDFNTWEAPEPLMQLDEEALDDEKGKGRIFVPAITDAQLEPNYNIYKGSKLIKENCPVGESIFLNPGGYTIMAPSNLPRDYQSEIKLEVAEMETYIVDPVWAALVVKVIDTNRDYKREWYEIFELKSDRSLGIDVSVDEDEPNEHQRTWLIKPGLYKIVKFGEPFNTFENFATVYLRAGELSVVTIVLDDNGEFKGAGELKETAKIIKTQKWSNYTSVKSSFTFFGGNLEAEDDFINNMTISAKIDNENRYDNFPHYLSLHPYINIGMIKDDERDFRIYNNEIKFDNSYIYYFIKQFGLYLRTSASSQIFPKEEYYSSVQDSIVKIDENGNREVFYNTDNVEFQPFLFPVALEEGVGFNLSLYETGKNNLDVKVGLGFSQNLNNDVFVKDTVYARWKEAPSVYTEGLEVILEGDFQIYSSINYKGKFRTLYPFKKDDDQTFSFENTFNIRLTSYISIDYTLNIGTEIKEIKGSKNKWVAQQHDLALNFTFISF